jgi:predicted dehydrogenase
MGPVTERVRIAILGGGAIAQLAHLPVLAKMRGVELVALCDSDGAKARALAERFGVPNVLTDIDDLLELDTLDAVVVATPNHLHEPHVLSVLARKLPVLCERPLAMSVRGVERILAAATRAEQIVTVANNHRFRSDVQALARFLGGGELGRVHGIRAGAYHIGRPDGWRTRRPESGGGVFFEHGLPLLDLALWLSDFPEPQRVSAHMDRGRGASSVEDSMLVHLECAGALSCSLDISWSYVGEQDRWWFEVLAGRGSARLAPLRVVKSLNGRATDVSPTGAAARESVFLQSYRAELAHFVAVLQGDVKYEAPTDQLIVLKVLEAIYRSGDDSREIKL